MRKNGAVRLSAPQPPLRGRAAPTLRGAVPDTDPLVAAECAVGAAGVQAG